MHFWLFEEEIPVLTIEISERQDFELEPTLKFHYTYLYPLVKMNATTTATKSEVQAVVEPKFAVVLRDENMAILQGSILVERNNTKVNATFEIKNSTFFMVNAVYRGNFIVRYPSSTYEAFFDWLEKEDIVMSIFKTMTWIKIDYVYFIEDLINLSARNLVDVKYLFRLIDNINTISYIDQALVAYQQGSREVSFFFN